MEEVRAGSKKPVMVLICVPPSCSASIRQSRAATAGDADCQADTPPGSGQQVFRRAGSRRGSDRAGRRQPAGYRAYPPPVAARAHRRRSARPQQPPRWSAQARSTGRSAREAHCEHPVMPVVSDLLRVVSASDRETHRDTERRAVGVRARFFTGQDGSRACLLQHRNAQATISGNSACQNGSPWPPTRSVIMTSAPASRSASAQRVAFSRKNGSCVPATR